MPNAECRKKPEIRIPNGRSEDRLYLASVSGFDLRISFGFRHSDFGFHFRSFLLNKITPIIATSSSTETTSNGSRYCVNNSLPSAAGSPSSVGADKFAPGFVATIYFQKIVTMGTQE